MTRIKVAIVAVVLCVLSGLGTATARADAVSDYVIVKGPVVCLALDLYPSFAGIESAGVAVMQGGGFSAYDAGRVIRQSVYYFCPRHARLIDLYLRTYGGQSVVAR